MTEKSNGEIVDAALDYVARGYAVVPIDYQDKKPTHENWQDIHICSEADVHLWFGGKRQNIGVDLARSKLVDVDMDCDEAIALAPRFLPPTGAIFGRKSKRRSHWFYQLELPDVGSKISIKDAGDDGKPKEICALRIGPGQQTVVPRSKHKDSGELIEWDEDGKPSTPEGATLLRRFCLWGAAALLARH